MTEQTEAMVSATIKLVGEKGGDILFTVRSGATPSDVENTLDNLVAGIKYAGEKYHLTPKLNGHAIAAPAGNGQPVQAPAGQAPSCQYHGEMKPSNHGGWFCTAKMGDGSYCKEKSK